MQHQTIFAPKDFDPAKLDRAFHDIPSIEEKKKKIERWQGLIIGGRLLSMKEEQLRDEFLKTFFGDVLDYSYDISADTCQLQIERSTEFDSKTPDGSLGFFNRSGEDVVKAVIELKGSKINLDKKQNRKDFPGTPVEQAFSYVPKMGGQCRWVIVSDFVEIRLYHASDMRRYERFFIPDLFLKDNLKKFFFLLYKDRLFWQNGGTSPTDGLLESRRAAQEKIEDEFYGEYAASRLLLLNALRRDNSSEADEALLGCSQRLLDRLIFIAFVRDIPIVRDVFRHLMNGYDESFSSSPLLAWQLLKDLFHAFDSGYSKRGRNIPPFNGGLFKPDPLLENLALTDDTLLDLLKPEGFLRRYDFQSELDVNILGHIFEKSIGDIEKIKADLAAGNELPAPPPPDDTNKKKKHGIFYTPEYITHYIVEQTVGGWLDDRRREVLAELGVAELFEPAPADYESIAVGGGCNELIALHRRFWEAYRLHLRRIKVLDPACGSGAFLNQVFNRLYEEWKIVEAETKKLDTPLNGKSERVSEGIFANGNGGSTDDSNRDSAIRKDIVVNNLFGVDLSAESVEITKLSLWLKTANRTHSLADLSDNIRHGNSLVDDPAVDALAFRWEDGFKEIMDGGGFDVVVGNPPYVDIKQLPSELVRHFLATYATAENRINLYALFIERAFSMLKPDGGFSFIVPNSLLVNSSYLKCRQLLFDAVHTIVKLPDHVFPDASVETIVIVCHKGKSITHANAIIYPREAKIEEINGGEVYTLLDKTNWNGEWLAFNIHATNEIQGVIKKTFQESVPLGEVCDFALGITPYDKYKGHSEELMKSKGFHAPKPLDTTYKPLIAGENIRRYYIDETASEYIKYGDWLGAMREERFFLEPRIIVRQIVSGKPPKIFASYTEKPLYFTQIGFSLLIKDEQFHIKYVLSLLNSSLLNFVHKFKFLDIEKEVFQKILIENARKFPIKLIDPADQAPFIAQADLLLQKHRELHDGTSTFLRLLQANFPLATVPKKLEEWHRLDWKELLEEMKKAKAPLKPSQQAEWLAVFEEQRKTAGHALAAIEQADRELDRMVFGLYGLTEAEIALVERSA